VENRVVGRSTANAGRTADKPVIETAKKATGERIAVDMRCGRTSITEARNDA
jgi:hypothetical protein